MLSLSTNAGYKGSGRHLYESPKSIEILNILREIMYL